MKYLPFLCCTLVLSFAMSANKSIASSGNVNATIGAKAMDEDDWEPVDDQSEFGIRFDFRGDEWPINLAIDFSVSAAEEDDVYIDGEKFDFTASTSELNFGIRKIWEPPIHMRPYFGGGLAIISAELEGEHSSGLSLSDDDSGVGFWFGGGLYWTIGNHFNIGFDLRYSEAEVTIFDVDLEAGGGHFGFLIGYHW